MNPLQTQIKQELEDYDPEYLQPLVPIKWDDYLIEPELCSTIPLVVEQSPYSGYIAVTLNYPRTPQFLKYNQAQQCRFLKNIFNGVVHGYESLILDSNMTFEHCKTGQIHLHGVIKLQGKYFIAGAISDIAKAFKKFIPTGRKYTHVRYFNERSYNPVYERYRDAYICLQHFDPYDKRIPEWETYINKENYNPQI